MSTRTTFKMLTKVYRLVHYLFDKLDIVCSKMLFIELIVVLSDQNYVSMKRLATFNGFLFLVSLLSLTVNTFTYIMFNLSYLVEDSNQKILLILVVLSVNLFPIYNLLTLTLRLLFNLNERYGRRLNRSKKYLLRYDLKEMIRNFICQEFTIQLYYLLFVWTNRYISYNYHFYG